MGVRQYSNFPSGVGAANPFATLVTDGGATLTLTTGHGARFASPTGSQFQLATCTRAADNVIEIVKITSRTGDVLTVTRGQEGTVQITLNAGDSVEPGLTAGVLAQLPQMDSAESVTGPWTGSDGAYKAASVILTGQSAAVADPASTDSKLFAKLITANAPMAMPFVRDGLGASSRVPEQPLQLASWPTAGSWHLTEYDGAGVIRGYGAQAMSNLTKASVSLTAFASGSFRGEAAPRLLLTSTAAANAVAGVGPDANISNANIRGFWRGNATGRGGFLFSALFDLTTMSTSTGRMFAGLSAYTGASSLGSADYVAADAGIGLGFNDADTNVVILCSDGTTLAKVPLDTTRTKTTVSGKMYWVVLAAAPNASSIWCYVVEFTSSSYSGTVLMDELLTQNGTVNATTVKIPPNTAVMKQTVSLGTGSGTGACALGWVTGLAWSPR